MAAVVMAGAGGVGLGVLGASPAAAATATINCDQASRRSSDWGMCTQLVGTASCVWDNGDGSYTAAIGYRNPTSYVLEATAARYPGRNYMTATGGYAANPGHISAFEPGTSTTAFTATWSPRTANDPLTWDLMGHKYSWSVGDLSPCPAAPVPVQNPIALTVLSLFLIVPVGWVVMSRRSTVLSRRRASTTAG